MRQLLTVRANVERILGIEEKEKERQKEKKKERWWRSSVLKSAPKGERNRMTGHAKMGFGEDFPQQAKRLWITRGIACHDCNKYL